METIPIIKLNKYAIFFVLLGLVILLSSISLKSQTPKDFSGKWEFDKTKSTPGQIASNYEGVVIRTITQTTSTLTYSEIYTKSDNADWATEPEVYNLDGKETSEKFSLGIIKKTAKWTDDFQSITLTYIDERIKDGVSEQFLNAETLKVSDDGQTLTIKTYSKNPVQGETTSLSIYHKRE
ncbi:MAG: hypothetical protein IPM71_05375 [Bacteroidota bacterium]|nr:MAG: hypothetical protein IPM71_05375 [Bacteroidota bacterium]